MKSCEYGPIAFQFVTRYNKCRYAECRHPECRGAQREGSTNKKCVFTTCLSSSAADTIKLFTAVIQKFKTISMKASLFVTSTLGSEAGHKY